MVFGISSFFERAESHNPDSNKYEAFKGYTNKKLNLLARKHLNRFDREKFNDAMDDKIKTGRTMSATRILKEIGKEVGRELGSDYAFRFKKRVKDKMFVEHHHDGLTERQKERNRLRTKYERLMDEDRLSDGHGVSEDYHSATAPAEAPRASFFQPGSTESSSHDQESVNDEKPSNHNFIRPPV